MDRPRRGGLRRAARGARAPRRDAAVSESVRPRPEAGIRQRAAARAADEVDDQRREGDRQDDAAAAAAEDRPTDEAGGERAGDADQDRLGDRHRVRPGKREPPKRADEEAADRTGGSGSAMTLIAEAYPDLIAEALTTAPLGRDPPEHQCRRQGRSSSRRSRCRRRPRRTRTRRRRPGSPASTRRPPSVVVIPATDLDDGRRAVARSTGAPALRAASIISPTVRSRTRSPSASSRTGTRPARAAGARSTARRRSPTRCAAA